MKKKTKLLHVTSSLKIGGAETVLCDLIDGLGTQNFEHHVIFFHDGPRADQLRTMGVPLYHITGFVSLYDPIFFFRLFRAIKKLQPDCIHSLLWAANVSSRVIARMLSIPHICVYHNNIDQDGMVRNLFDRMTRNFSNQLVAVSDEVATSIGANDVKVIKNGIDYKVVQKKSMDQQVSRSSLDLHDDQFVVGSVGRFCPVKNYPLLIESFSKLYASLPEGRLVLVGVGPDEQYLRQLVKDRGISEAVKFIVGKSAYGYIPLFDCFVQSSNKEGISIALLEAMACGIPSIVTNEGPAHSVLTHGQDGLVIEACPACPPKPWRRGKPVPSGVEERSRRAENLADAILNLRNNRDFAKKLGVAARETIEKDFSKNDMVQTYKKLFLRFSKRN